MTIQENDSLKEQLAQKDAEIIRLKQEIKKLESQRTDCIPVFQDVLSKQDHISIKTEDEALADMIKKGLCALGTDLDFKVRSGTIEVTTVSL